MTERTLAVDRVMATYAALSGAALLFPGRVAVWPILAAAHVLFILLVLRLGPAGSLTSAVSRRAPRLAGFVAVWYPLLLLPFMYTELALLNVSVWQGAYFDPVILRWEQSLFGFQPSVELAYRLPYLVLSEFLHACYVSYYFLIYIPAIAVWVLGRRPETVRMIFTMMLVFAVHYLVFIYFPVQGPRYLFPAPDPGISGGPIYRLVHIVLEGGSSRGSAFPSSHVAVSMAQTISCFRYLPRAAPVVLVATLGMSVGAVYGGFHYGIDILIGLVIGGALAAAAPVLRRALES